MQGSLPSSPQDIESIYTRISAILLAARNSAWQAINSTMVTAYWEVGKTIVEEEQKGKKKAGYGEKLIQNLSGRLLQEFGKGFGTANLKAPLIINLSVYATLFG